METRAAARIRPANDAAIADAARILRDGGLVAFPTETVYGLGADATNDRAVARVFEAKGRPSFNPLIVHVHDLAEADNYAVFNAAARTLARGTWPGPLTLVLPRKPKSPLSELVSAGLDTVALRVPAHPIARKLIAAVGRPLAAPSANASGKITATAAAHVAQSLGNKVDLILDGGKTKVGVESTVIGFQGTQPVMLRTGAISRDRIQAAIGKFAEPGDTEIQAPGQLASHYAPRGKVRLNALKANPGETLLGYGPKAPASALNLSRTGNIREAAANLFAMLHQLNDAPAIAVMPIPDQGLGEAINDRLRRAAAPRDTP
jgi:L-threonylcarbamoyladenylate synthase